MCDTTQQKTAEPVFATPSLEGVVELDLRTLVCAALAANAAAHETRGSRLKPHTGFFEIPLFEIPQRRPASFLIFSTQNVDSSACAAAVRFSSNLIRLQGQYPGLRSRIICFGRS